MRRGNEGQDEVARSDRDELGQKAQELREEVFNLRFQLSMGVAKNPARVGQARRDLARVQTLLRERALGAAGAVRRSEARRAEDPGRRGGQRQDDARRAWCVIERVFRHPRYERVITRSKRLKAHDESNASKVGDRVLIEETRPLSKDKRWRIKEILARAS